MERIMERKILNLEQHVEFLYDELENKEKEIDNLTKSLGDANDSCRRISGSRKDDLDDILQFKKVVKEQTEKICCLRKHRDEILDRHEKAIDDYESEFKAKEDDIKNLQDISKQQKRELNDQKEELSAKNLELKELRSTLFNFEAKCSNSLSEELKTANLEVEKDRLENENKVLRLQVEKLEKAKEERSLQYSKMEEVSSRMNMDLHNLKKRMISLPKVSEKTKCNLKWKCNRIFCTLDHTFLYRKVNSHKISSSSSCSSSERKMSCFKCEKCGLEVTRESQLEVHNRLKHEDTANFNCEICPFKCNQEEKLKEHRRLKHEIASEKCSETFPSVQILKEHQEKHKVKRIVKKKKDKTPKKRKSNKKAPNLKRSSSNSEQNECLEVESEAEGERLELSVLESSEMSSVTSLSSSSSTLSSSGEEA